ncbi:MAG: enoyl-CoA hydratase/isomerase family protein, partial [Rhodospirillaceae bacterium]|nr:enoyl-CoA hydratase/isomerase family protein [Rhodospirillaceae bacterium]
MTSSVSVVHRDTVAVITIDNPPVNAINHEMRVDLLQALRAIAGDLDIDAAVIAAGGKTFMAGSDIREFDAPAKEPLAWQIVDAIEALSIPVVAAIHGTALGGGFEVALGCHGRVAEKSAKVGLPEINLGIIPGAGGTQRLPRLIGAEKALDWILSGKQVIATEAQKAGAIDQVVESSVLEAAI